MSQKDVVFMFMAVVVALLLLSAGLALRVESLQEPRMAVSAADTSWKTTPPPEGEPIIGMWGDTMYPRAHVVVMIRGEAFAYGPPDEPVAILEAHPPIYWRRLP